MKPLKNIIFPAMAFLLLTGCMASGIKQIAPDDQIDVFGIRLLSSDDYRELKGVAATEET